MANQNPLTLTRQQLYDLVWSKPVRDVAKDFGMSDVALAKRCRAVRVPIPPRGYWARVAAGQKPRRPTLPKYRGSRTKVSGRFASEDRRAAGLAACPTEQTDQSPGGNRADDEPTVTFTPRPTPAPTEHTTPISPAEAALRTRIDALHFTLGTDLSAAHTAVLRTAVHLKHLKSRDLTWPRGTRSGPIIEVRNVSEAQQDRAFKVLDALLRGAAALGWPFEAPPPDPNADRRQSFARSTYRPPVYGHLITDGEPLQLRIDERQRQSDHVPTEQEKADKKLGRHVWMPRFDYAPSGELRLHVTEPGHSYTEKVWKDTKAHPLEVQVRRILHGLLDLALDRKSHREEKRLREIAAREFERQQAIVRHRRAANLKLIEELERQAGAWHRARFLRRYLRAAVRVLGDDSLTVDMQGQPTDFIRWAEHYVNQLDPLHPRDAAQSCSVAAQPEHPCPGVRTAQRDIQSRCEEPLCSPPCPDLAHERDIYYRAKENRFTEELQRLLGHQWEATGKRSEDESINSIIDDTDP